MDKRLLDQLSLSFEAAKRMDACEKRRCRAEKAVYETALKAHREAVSKAIGKSEDWPRRVKKMKEELYRTASYAGLAECRLEKCRGEFLVYFKAALANIDLICKIDKKGCKLLDEGKKALASKDITKMGAFVKKAELSSF